MSERLSLILDLFKYGFTKLPSPSINGLRDATFSRRHRLQSDGKLKASLKLFDDDFND